MTPDRDVDKMKDFEVEIWESHTQKIAVQACSAADAIRMVQGGEGNSVDGSEEFIETDFLRNMAEHFRIAAGISTALDTESIRNIEEV